MHIRKKINNFDFILTRHTIVGNSLSILSGNGWSTWRIYVWQFALRFCFVCNTLIIFLLMILSFFHNCFSFFFNINNTFSLSCLVHEYQLNLPDPATPIMFGIHNLHNHILFFLCLILASVLFLLFSVLFFFSFYDDKYYDFSFYKNAILNGLNFAGLFSIVTLLSFFSRINISLKFVKFRNVFNTNALFFRPFFLFASRSLSFLIVLFSIATLPIFSVCSWFYRTLTALKSNIIASMNFIGAFFNAETGFATPAVNFERFFILTNYSFNLILRYHLIRLASSFSLSSAYRNLVLFLEWSTVLSFIPNLYLRHTLLNYKAGLGFFYKTTLTYRELRSFCNWFFSSHWKNKIFSAISFPNVFDAAPRHSWLTYLIVNKQYRVTHNLNLEVIWTIIPTIILIFIAIPSFALLYSMDELLDPTITVKVIGHQWYWSYEYTDFRPLCNQTVKFDSYMVPDADLQFGDLRLLKTDCPLILPKETNIRFLITSTDVLHSWAMPSFGIKMDAVPGRLNQTSTYIMESGRYYGQCSELCGVNHAFMPIEICVVEPRDYYNWMFLKITNG